MEEHGAAKAPPFSILCGRPEIRSPGQLHIIRGMPEPRASGKHCSKDEEIAGYQQFGNWYLRYTPAEEFMERLHGPVDWFLSSRYYARGWTVTPSTDGGTSE
jgi:hypothetical protein